MARKDRSSAALLSVTDGTIYRPTMKKVLLRSWEVIHSQRTVQYTVDTYISSSSEFFMLSAE